MSIYDEYAKRLAESEKAASQAVDVSTQQQLATLEQNKKLAEAEKQTAYRGAYTDYAKNINPYGVQSERAVASGLGGAGKSETAQANYYNAYQNRLGEINTSAGAQLRDYDTQAAQAQAQAQSDKLSLLKDRYANEASGLWTQEQLAQSAAAAEESKRQYDQNMAYQRERDAISDAQSAAAASSASSSGRYSSNSSNYSSAYADLVSRFDSQLNNLPYSNYNSSGNFDYNPTGTFKKYAAALVQANASNMSADEYNKIVLDYGLLDYIS